MTVVVIVILLSVCNLADTPMCGNGLHQLLFVRLHCSHLCIPGSGRDQFHPNILDPVCKVSSAPALRRLIISVPSIVSPFKTLEL